MWLIVRFGLFLFPVFARRKVSEGKNKQRRFLVWWVVGLVRKMAHEYTTYLSGVVLPSCEIQGFKLKFWKNLACLKVTTTRKLHWQMFDQKLILVGFVTGRGIVSGSFIWQLPLSISSISCIIHGCAGVVRWSEAGEGMVIRWSVCPRWSVQTTETLAWVLCFLILFWIT